MENKKLAIFDNGLLYSHGHHLGYNLGAASIAIDGGADYVKIFSHIKFNPDSKRGLIEPHFRRWLYSGKRSDACIETIEDLIQGLNIIPEKAVIFLPNVRMSEIKSMIEVANLGHFKNRKVIVFIRYAELFGDAERESELIGLVAKLTAKIDQVRFVSDTESIAKKLQSAKKNVSVLGFPQRIPFNEIEFKAVYDFGYFGHAGAHKGFSVFVNALKYGAQIGFKPKVFIHCVDLSRATVLALRSDPHFTSVEFLELPLSDMEFYEKMASTSVVVNLCNPIHYAYGTSGILLEALALRRRVITTDYPWSRELMGDNFVDRNHVVFDDPGSLLRKMIREYCKENFDASIERGWDIAWNKTRGKKFFEDVFCF